MNAHQRHKERLIRAGAVRNEWQRINDALVTGQAVTPPMLRDLQKSVQRYNSVAKEATS